MALKKLLVFSVLFTNSLLYATIPEIVEKAAQLYQKERKELKNYKVKHLVVSKIQSPSQTLVEKRVQIGYFVAPDKFLFIIKEKWINGEPVLLQKEEVEKSSKREIDWLSIKGLREYQFKFVDGNETVAKYKVTSNKKGRDYYNGEIWIDPVTYKILKIIKEPSELPNGYEKFQTELYFDSSLPYQEPYLSKLEAIFYNEKMEKTYAYVDASFSNYEFNVPLK